MQERQTIDTLCLEVSVPAAAVLRDLSLNYHLVQQCARTGGVAAGYRPSFVGVKDTAKAGIIILLERLGKTVDQTCVGA